MKTLALLLALSLAACVTRVQPQAPTTPQAPATKQPKLVEKFVSLVPVLGKCDAWTDDSVLCHPTATTLLYCQAPLDGRPHCEAVLDWTPQAAPQPQAPAPAKADEPIAKPAPKKK